MFSLLFICTGWCAKIYRSLFSKQDFGGTVEEVFEEQLVLSKERDERHQKILQNDSQAGKISWLWALLVFAGVFLGFLVVAGHFLILPMKNVFLFEDFW